MLGQDCTSANCVPAFCEYYLRFAATDWSVSQSQFLHTTTASATREHAAGIPSPRVRTRFLYDQTKV